MGEIGVFPNPSAGTFQFKWEQPAAGAVSVELFNETAYKVFQKQLGNFPSGSATYVLELGQNLPNGLYLARFCSIGGCQPVFLALQRR
jgi:hypothetical protein